MRIRKGEVFGRLTVISMSSRKAHKHWFYFAKCSCGCEVEVCGKSLKSGNTRSCGCLRRELATTREKHSARSSDGRFAAL
jgi:hypothetical protein